MKHRITSILLTLAGLAFAAGGIVVAATSSGDTTLGFSVALLVMGAVLAVIAAALLLDPARGR